MADKLCTGFQKKGVMNSNSERQPSRGGERSTSVNSFSLQSSPHHSFVPDFTWKKKQVPSGLRTWGKHHRIRSCSRTCTPPLQPKMVARVKAVRNVLPDWGFYTTARRIPKPLLIWLGNAGPNGPTRLTLGQKQDSILCRNDWGEDAGQFSLLLLFPYWRCHHHSDEHTQ